MTDKRVAAETTALKALAWLAANEELLPVFMGSTGASSDDFKDQASDPTFLGSVLDFILMDDAWIVQVCDAIGLEYAQLQSVRMALPGGDQVHWT